MDSLATELDLPDAQGSRMVTEADVEELVEQVYAAQLEWVNGTFNSLFDLTQGTIFGPFGGPAMGGPGFSEAQARLAARFHDGSADLDVVQSIISGEVVCLVV